MSMSRVSDLAFNLLPPAGELDVYNGLLANLLVLPNTDAPASAPPARGDGRLPRKTAGRRREDDAFVVGSHVDVAFRWYMTGQHDGSGGMRVNAADGGSWQQFEQGIKASLGEATASAGSGSGGGEASSGARGSGSGNSGGGGGGGPVLFTMLVWNIQVATTPKTLLLQAALAGVHVIFMSEIGFGALTLKGWWVVYLEQPRNARGTGGGISAALLGREGIVVQRQWSTPEFTCARLLLPNIDVAYEVYVFTVYYQPDGAAAWQGGKQPEVAWDELAAALDRLPSNAIKIVGGDCNAHTGTGRDTTPINGPGRHLQKALLSRGVFIIGSTTPDAPGQGTTYVGHCANTPGWIDYFCTNARDAVAALSVLESPLIGGKRMSDHNPLLCTMDVSGAPSVTTAQFAREAAEAAVAWRGAPPVPVADEMVRGAVGSGTSLGGNHATAHCMGAALLH